MRRTLIVMVKEPRAGRVKTRLGREIGMVAAAWWFRHQVRRLLRRIEDPRWQVVLAVAPDRAGMLSRVWPEHLARWPQGQGDLGARMALALRRASGGPACVIGADIPDTTLLIAGNGQLQQELEDLAKQCQVRDRVKFLGLRKDIQELFDLADICVFPSRFEPLGNVVLEAWATHTPIVAAASQGPSWLITHEKDGLLFEVDSATGCAQAVNRLLNNPEFASELAKNGHDVFRERFSKDIIVDQYKALFTTLVNARQKAGLTESDPPGSL